MLFKSIRFTAFFALIFSVSSASAQIDSLLNALKSADATERIILYDELSYQTVSADIPQARIYSDSAVAIARRLGNDSLLVLALNGLSFPQIYAGDFPQAEVTLKEALELNKEANDPRREGALWMKLGTTFSERKSLIKAEKAYQQAISYFKEAGDAPALAQTYGNLASVALYSDQFEKVVNYANEAVAILRPYNAHYQLGAAYGNVALGYSGLEQEQMALAYFDSVIIHFEAIDHRKGLADAYMNQGVSYRKLGELQKGLATYRKASAISEEIGDEGTLANATANIASVLADLGQHRQALEKNREAFRLAKAQENGVVLVQTLNGMVENYIHLGDAESAMMTKRQYETVNDSINGLEQRKALLELQTRYETAEKERDLATQNLQLAQQDEVIAEQDRRLALLSGGALSLLLVFGLLYTRLQARKKAAIQDAVISEQERGIRAVITAQEEERQRIARELHDGIGQQLSAIKMGLASAVLTAKEESKHNLQTLTEAFSQSADEVRSLSHQMMPKALKEEGLTKAMEGLLRNSFGFAGLAHNFDHRIDESALNDEQKITLYRVAQELVNNVLKHAEARNVEVQLIGNSKRVMLLVEDDGKGIPVGESSDGHGLLNIKSRLHMVGGKIHFEPGATGGAVATVTVPLT